MNTVYKDKDDLAPVCDGEESVTTTTKSRSPVGSFIMYLESIN